MFIKCLSVSKQSVHARTHRETVKTKTKDFNHSTDTSRQIRLWCEQDGSSLRGIFVVLSV